LTIKDEAENIGQENSSTNGVYHLFM